jgi:hypothetical protein
MAHVRRGEFAAAWTISDAVLHERRGRPCWHLPRHQQYIWNGRPLDGARVLVRCYHGLGDTIQFARYAPLIGATATSVTFWAQPALMPLLRTVGGIDRLLPLHDGAPEGEYDVEVESMELPHVFRSTLEALPADVPYIHVPALFLDRLLPHARMRVGLFWRTGGWDGRRSIPSALVSMLAGIPGVQLCMVRRDYEAAGRPPCVSEIPYDDDICGTARIMRGLDLVISADSMPAHLAGALGVPTWVLLHDQPDWRWMDDRPDSPWYPTVRLFRQQGTGGWRDVVEQVAVALKSARPVSTRLHPRCGSPASAGPAQSGC